MKLNEMYVETHHEDRDYHIYQIILPGGKSAALLLESNEKRFVAAFACIDDAREAVRGFPQEDQEGNQWILNTSEN